MLSVLLVTFALNAPPPKELRKNDDVIEWYKNPKLEEKWLDDKNFNRLIKVGVEAGLLVPNSGFWLYATDNPSLRFRKWFLESLPSMQGGVHMSLPYVNPPLIVQDELTKKDYEVWDE